jgi:hypothetical protein
MRILILAILLAVFSPLALAETTSMEKEIEHLMRYIQDSNCKFIRNGKEHSSAEASQHILKKYNYFKDIISTTEDFIEFCASKSTVSNQPYRIACPGQALAESEAWLRRELAKMRSQ